MRQRRQGRDDVDGRAVMRGHFLAADVQTEIHHVVDGALRVGGLLRGGEPALDVAEQRLGEERIVIGRAMPDLHRFPHRLGDPRPGRIDQRAGRECAMKMRASEDGSVEFL